MAVLLLLIPLSFAKAQAARAVCGTTNETREQCYKLFEPSGSTRGLFVLLPSFGGKVDAYDTYRLPALLAERGVATMVVSLPERLAGYTDDEPLEALQRIIVDVARLKSVASPHIAIGGLSAGGSGAVRYAQYCAMGKCNPVTRPAAVAAVDPPLDLERFWNAQELNLRRGSEKSVLGESRAILAAMRRTLGGSPTEARARYVALSPLLVSEPDGGNARFLREYPVRLYSEPDLAWYIENFNRDAYTINILDEAAMILQLRLLGNERAELITTTGKGFRPNGQRNPHSWSIVDEPDLAAWLVRQMGLETSTR